MLPEAALRACAGVFPGREQTGCATSGQVSVIPASRFRNLRRPIFISPYGYKILNKIAKTIG
jgi:hypothetical protein